MPPRPFPGGMTARSPHCAGRAAPSGRCGRNLLSGFAIPPNIAPAASRRDGTARHLENRIDACAAARRGAAMRKEEAGRRFSEWESGFIRGWIVGVLFSVAGMVVTTVALGA